MYAPVHCFQDALAYLVTTVSYARKMFMKFPPGPRSAGCSLEAGGGCSQWQSVAAPCSCHPTPGVNGIKLFFLVVTEATEK